MTTIFKLVHITHNFAGYCLLTITTNIFNNKFLNCVTNCLDLNFSYKALVLVMHESINVHKTSFYFCVATHVTLCYSSNLQSAWRLKKININLKTKGTFLYSKPPTKIPWKYITKMKISLKQIVTHCTLNSL